MIEFHKKDKQLVCKPSTGIIASNVIEIRNLLLVELDSNTDWEELVFDCEFVETIDSIGVNLIVGLFKKTLEDQKKFRITQCNEPLMKVLKLFRLNEQFSVESI